MHCNIAWVAKDALKKFGHIGTLRDYVNEFSSLIFDIENIPEEDKLFNYMTSLQPWVHEGVASLPNSMVVADGLVDFKYPSFSSALEKKIEAMEKAKKGKKTKGFKKNNI